MKTRLNAAHKKLIILGMICGMGLGVVPWSWGQDKETQGLTSSALQEMIDEDLKERTKYSGTLDIFDPQINAVRHLQKIELPKELSAEGEGKTAVGKFRDTASGAMVQVLFVMGSADGLLTVSDIKIGKVEELSADTSTAELKTYSDEDVRNFINTYLESQQKFSGNMTIFDEKQQKLRSVQLQALEAQVRRFGKLSIVRGTFKDTETQSPLAVDITVENAKTGLQIQSLIVR